MALFSCMKPCVSSLWTRHQKVASILYGQSRNVKASEYFQHIPTVTALHTSPNALTGVRYPPPPGKIKAQFITPEVHRRLQRNRKVDGLCEDWEQIYDDTLISSIHKYLLFVHLETIAWVVVGLPYEAYEMYTLYYEDDYTVIAGFVLSECTEAALLTLGMSCLQFMVWYFARQVPRRIYYNECEDRYLGVWKSWIPFRTRQSVFSVDDIVKRKKFPIFYLIYFPVQYMYHIKNKPSILPPMLFFRGIDCTYMVDRSSIKD